MIFVEYSPYRAWEHDVTGALLDSMLTDYPLDPQQKDLVKYESEYNFLSRKHI